MPVELPTEIPYEFLRPIVTGWVSKLNAAEAARSSWSELADECRMFYARSAAAMWNPEYQRKFWKDMEPPRFRITLNLAYEYVAVFGPSLLWETPHRQAKPKRVTDLPPEAFGGEESQMYQAYQQEADSLAQGDEIISHLMQDWLNYTAREQTGGGLVRHSELGVLDALITGRGCLWPRPYLKPGSPKKLTGCFHTPPESLYTDPDFQSLNDCQWIALKHIDPHWSVERRFGLPANSLQNRASLESSWGYGESAGNQYASMWRAAGQTNDLIVWYEIWSKMGVGARLTGMHTGIRDTLEKTVGDFAYLAISADVPFPLNCSAEALRSGIQSADVKNRFSWPSPFWGDGRWPVQCLDFYPNTDPKDPGSAWPVPPLAPAMGEIKFLNFIIPWLANRLWSSTRDFWCVAGPHYEHYLEYLQKGSDLCVIPTPVMVEDVSKAVQILQQPEVRSDIWRIVDIVTDLFRRRTGLVDYAYGQNEGGTQSRTAEDAMSKREAVGVRPEFLRKKVVAWQSDCAAAEALVTRRFITGEDVSDRYGRIGSMVWNQHIMSTDVARVVREMEYTIAASSIRRPNRDRDITNFMQAMQYWLAVMQEYAGQTGTWEPINGLIAQWGELHDMDVSDLMLPPPQPDPEQQKMEQQQLQLEQQKLTTEIETAKIDLQKAMIDAQVQSQTGQAEVIGQQLDMAQDQQKHDQDLRQDQTKHLLDLLQDRQKFEQQLTQTQQLGKVKLAMARKPQTNGSRVA